MNILLLLLVAFIILVLMAQAFGRILERIEAIENRLLELEEDKGEE